MNTMASGNPAFPRDTSRRSDSDSDDTLYVAVPKDYKEGKSVLGWALTYFPLVKKIILVHIHQPSQSIPMLGGRFPINQVDKVKAQAYHQLEREKVDKALDNYTPVCRRKKVKVEKLIVDNGDVAKGLLELIESHGIQKLVTGAASDKRYSKDMNKPKSSLARTLRKEAQPQCDIWFVWKGNLICTREGCSNESSDSSPLSRSNTISTQSGPSKSKPFKWFSLKQTSRSRSSISRQEDSIRSSPDIDPHGTRADLTREQIPSIRELDSSFYTGGNESASDSGSITMQTGRNNEEHLRVVPSKDNVVDDPYVSTTINKQIEMSLVLDTGTGPEEDLEISTAYVQDNLEYDALYEKLQQVLSEANKLTDEARAQSERRFKEVVVAMRRSWKANTQQWDKNCKEKKQEVEKLKSHLEELNETHEQRLDLEMQAKKLEIKYAKEIQLRKEAEESLQREKQEVQNLRERQAEISEELRKAQEQQLTLELQLAGSNNGSSQRRPSFNEFSYSEINQATDGFAESNFIGVGGFGSVYKGFLRHTTVAIKRLDSTSFQGRKEFDQEIEVLSRVRHPNIVTLIGACSEICALVYEFLPNGSLEDRLICKGNTTPLPWQVRTRICAEICSALIFLHSNKPDSVVHGDVKPANILLDCNFTCKLGDFGISRSLAQSSTTATPHRQTDPKGTFHYMDPEFRTTEFLTHHCDIFSFGVTILRLLTGKEPHGIVSEVSEALNSKQLENIIDPSAGVWPSDQAQQLAMLGVDCCKMNRRERPDLARDVWTVLNQ